MINQNLGIEVPEAKQYFEMYDEINQLVDILRNGTTIKRKGEPDIEVPALENLIRLAAAARRDGFPTSSMRGSSRSSVLDEDKMPIAPVSDPTGELAAGERIVDPIKNHLKTVMRGLTGALGDLRMAKTAQYQASQYAEVEVGEPRCRSCEAIDEWSDVYRGERCRFCYGFWNIHHREPPAEILRAHHAGRKITAQMVREAFMPPKIKKAKVHSAVQGNA